MKPTEHKGVSAAFGSTGHKEKMTVIGLTGGIGAGKSTVLEFLRNLPGVQVEEADKAGHLVMEPGGSCFSRITDHFGVRILDGHGCIDRSVLGDIVYADRDGLLFLNSVIHPAVKQYMRDEIEKARASGTVRLLVIEAALLIEDHYEELCDEFWYVYAPEEVRIERLSSSRGYTREKSGSVMRNQLSDEEFRNACAETIDNGGSKEQTLRSLSELLIKKNLGDVLSQ